MTRDPAAKEGKGITPGPLYMMKALQIAGAIYVREEDCRASVNEALKITAADRDHLRERVKELAGLLELAQTLRPAMLKDFGYVPEYVLDFCNRAREFSKSPK